MGHDDKPERSQSSAGWHVFANEWRCVVAARSRSPGTPAVATAVPGARILDGIISPRSWGAPLTKRAYPRGDTESSPPKDVIEPVWASRWAMLDRKSTRLNSSHFGISYAVFCLKKKKISNSNSLRGLNRDIGARVSIRSH